MSSDKRNGSSRNYRYRKLSSSDSNHNGSVSGDDCPESYELQQRERKAQNQSSECSSSDHLVTSNILSEYETLIDRTIQHGESLTSIALKYRIPVSELKRVNHLQKEMEFYALKSLKIPVKANSSLVDVLAAETVEQSSQPATGLSLSPSSGSEMDSEFDIPTGVVSISQILREKNNRREAKEFLKNMQKDLIDIKLKTENYRSLDDETRALTDVSFAPLQTESKFRCSGADLDFSWRSVIAIVLRLQ